MNSYESVYESCKILMNSQKKKSTDSSRNRCSGFWKQLLRLQLLAEFTGQCVQLGFAGGVQSGFDRDGRVREGEILALFEETAHDFGGVGHPAAVFDQGDGTVLEVAFRQMRDERVHEGEDFGVVRRGRENEFAVLEGGFDCFGHIVAGEIEHLHIRGSS